MIIIRRVKLMIQVKLSEDARRELEEYRGQTYSKNSEKALMVLMSNNGKSAVEISRTVKRHLHTGENVVETLSTGGYTRVR